MFEQKACNSSMAGILKQIGRRQYGPSGKLGQGLQNLPFAIYPQGPDHQVAANSG
jgi:hypothetical protein